MPTLLNGAVLHPFAPPPSLAAAYDTLAPTSSHLESPHNHAVDFLGRVKSLMSHGLFAGLLLLTPLCHATAAPNDPAMALYRQHCASCHGSGRLGGMGPALLPENLSRLSQDKAREVVAEGRPATQMPGFAEVLDPAQIEALTQLIYTPLKSIPSWNLEAIQASHTMLNPRHTLPPEPVFQIQDLLNLFIVVELGDHHVTLLDGTTLTPIHRFPTRINLHGGPKFSPNGRFVYFASRDGWITQYDLYNLKVVAEIRAGINTRNLAVSADGHYVMVANYLPHTLVVLSGEDLAPLKLIPVQDAFGNGSRVSAVYTAPPRHSFIAALKDIKQLWEIPYSEKALPVYTGIMHDYRAESGEPPPIDKGPFPIRRIQLDDYLDDFFFDPPYRNVIGASRGGGKGQVVNLIVGRQIAEIDLSGMPHLGSGITWNYGNRSVLATPNLKEGVVSVIDMETWKTIERIKTLGPGFFMRSHENTPYAWVDVFFGPHHDAVHVIDKRTLKLVKTLRPEPGKTAAHVEFTRDGRYALLSIWDHDGAIIVYNAATFEEIKRLPMNKPSGKYNIYNKITLSRGTSH